MAQKTVAKAKAKKPKSTTTKKSAVAKKEKTEPKQTGKKTVQLPSPLTPMLAVASIGFCYWAFSLAIDSGSFWHYGFGFYFFYQSIRLTRLSIAARMNDKRRRATKA
jgi:hypothetical protein